MDEPGLAEPRGRAAPWTLDGECAAVELGQPVRQEPHDHDTNGAKLTLQGPPGKNNRRVLPMCCPIVINAFETLVDKTKSEAFSSV